MSQRVGKQALRRVIADRLGDLSPENIAQQSGMIAERLRRMKEYQAAKNIAFYMHMGSGEIQTDAMISNAFLDHKRVFLPHIVPLPKDTTPIYPGQRTHLQLLELPDHEAVLALKPRGKYNIREPTQGNDCLKSEGLDLIILPGVAFTKDCRRLGHGAAFYDSFIQEHVLRLGARPKLVAVSLEEQIVDTVPMETHDEVLDGVVTAGDTYRV